MNVKFKELIINDIDGSSHPEDWAGQVGNVLFRSADNVTEHELGIKIYHEQPEQGTDLTDDEVKIIRKYLPMFKYFLRSAIERALNA